jgi:hypothetical protein
MLRKQQGQTEQNHWQQLGPSQPQFFQDGNVTFCAVIMSVVIGFMEVGTV